MSSWNPLMRSWTLRWAVIACLLSPGCDKGKPAGTSPDRSGPIPAVEGIDEEGRLRFSEGDRCPVCAMKVKDHPKFACGIELEDGRTYYFCGTGCMIRTWLHPEVFLGVGRGALRRAVVQDYFEGRHMDALCVTWVAGSDVVGPMGPALVPVGNDRDLEVFRQRHGGRVTFRLADLDDPAPASAMLDMDSGTNSGNASKNLLPDGKVFQNSPDHHFREHPSAPLSSESTISVRSRAPGKKTSRNRSSRFS